MNEELLRDARLMERLRKRVHVLADAVATALLACGGFMASPGIFDGTASRWEYVGGGMLAVGLVVTFAEGHSRRRREKDRESYLSEIDRLKPAIAAVKDDLAECAKTVLRLTGDHDRTRVTIYGFDHRRSTFIPLVRVSANPELQRLGRREYPRDHGFIGQVWQKGSQSIRFVPSHRRQDYLDMSMDPDEIDGLTMMPTSMLGVRLEFKDEAAGLIIVENDATDYRKRPSVEPYLDQVLSLRGLLASTGALLFGMRDLLADVRDCDPEGTQHYVR